MITANNDLATTPAATPVAIDVLANDTHDGAPVAIGDLAGPPVVVTPPSNGTATVNPDGTVTYTPNPGFCGTDTFEYEIETAPPPANLSPPTITGGPLVGNTLTATPGTWANADTVVGEWFVDGVATGNTTTSYVVQVADAGLLIEYRETATNAGGSAQAVASVVATTDVRFLVTDNGGEPFAVTEGNFLVRAA